MQGGRKSLKPFGRGVYAKRVLRVRPMHLPRWLGPGVLAFVRHETSPAGVKLNGTKLSLLGVQLCFIAGESNGRGGEQPTRMDREIDR